MWNLKVVAGFVGAAGLAMLLAPAPALAANPTRTGEFIVDPPTLINLGFEWFIDGDDNRNAAVDVSLSQDRARPSGSRRCRCCACRASASTTARSSTSISPNMFAGSILDLEPDTAYEARFVLSDPDGVDGDAPEDRHRAHAAGADAVRGRPRRFTSIRPDSRDRRSSRRSKG